jgi:hypothetical protein
MDSMSFNAQIIDEAGCPMFNHTWTRLRIELGVEDVYLQADGLRNDTLEIVRGMAETRTVRIQPLMELMGYTFEWFTISTTNITTKLDSIGNQITVSYDTLLHGTKVFATATSPNGCELAYTDTIILIMTDPVTLYIAIDPQSMIYCDGGVTQFEANVTPPGVDIDRYQWEQRMVGSPTWTPIVPGAGTGVIDPSQTESVLRFSRPLTNTQVTVTEFRVRAWTTSGVEVISDSARVNRIPAIDPFSSSITRSPALGSVICMPEGGATVTYTAHAFPTPPVGISYEFNWTVTRPGPPLIVDSDLFGSPLVLTDVDLSYQGATVIARARAHSTCPWVQLGNPDIIQLQSVEDVKIQVDPTTLCSTFPIEFSIDFAFAGRADWLADNGTPPFILDSRTYNTRLPVGPQQVTVRVVASGEQCVIYDTIDIFVESGPPFQIEMDGSIFVPPFKRVEVGDRVDLRMVVDDPTSLQFRWRPVDSVTSHPVSSPNTQQTLTSVYNEPGMRQRILATITDTRGCVSQDTVIIEVLGSFNLDTVHVADVFLRPGTYPPTLDTVLKETFSGPSPLVGNLSVCENGILFIRPIVSGGESPVTYHWTASHAVEAYDRNLNRVHGTAGNTEFSTTDSILGFRMLTNANEITYVITAEDNRGMVTREMTVNVTIIPPPYMKIHLHPQMFHHAYYYNQVIQYQITPDRFPHYEFYRLIKGETDEFYQLDPEGTTANPQRGPNPVFRTNFKDGEDSNMVIGMVVDPATGCRNSDTVQVRLLPIPNVIIPEDDRYVLNRVFLPDFDIEVFDSWGLKIKDFGTKGWDGTYRGRPVRSGTYYYNARIPTPDGIITISGAVTVLSTPTNR